MRAQSAQRQPSSTTGRVCHSGSPQLVNSIGKSAPPQSQRCASPLASPRTATAEEHAASGSPAPATHHAALDRDTLTRVDVRGTATAIGLTLQDIERLTPERRARLVANYRVLAANCPYTRASLLLPQALHQVVQGLDVDQLDPLVHHQLADLKRGLATHVAVLDALEVDLAAPQPGDHLHGLPDDILIDRSTLESSDDPIAAIAPLIEQVNPLAEQLHGDALERVETHRQQAEVLLGQASMGVTLGAWESALRRIEPFVQDEAAAEDVRRLIDISRAWGVQGC